MTYLKYLDSLRASESFRSVWIFAESSYKIFEYAKKRVYHFGRSNGEVLTTPTKSVKSRKRKLDDSNGDKEGEDLALFFFLLYISLVIILMFCDLAKPYQY